MVRRRYELKINLVSQNEDDSEDLLMTGFELGWGMEPSQNPSFDKCEACAREPCVRFSAQREDFWPPVPTLEVRFVGMRVAAVRFRGLHARRDHSVRQGLKADTIVSRHPQAKKVILFIRMEAVSVPWTPAIYGYGNLQGLSSKAPNW
jgi:hypothetical protein